MKTQNTQLKATLKKYTILLAASFEAVCIGIYVYSLNFQSISSTNSYINNLSTAEKQLTTQPNIEIGKNYGFSGLSSIGSGLNDLNDIFSSKLKNFLSNTSLIEGDFKKSIENIKVDSPYYYFNLGNIYLLSGYHIALSGISTQDFINSYSNIYQSSGAYQRSLVGIGSGSSDEFFKNKVNTNLSASFVLEYLVNVKLCISIFGSIITHLDEISKKIEHLEGLISDQSIKLKNLISQSPDQNIKACLEEYQNELNNSVNALLSIKSFVKDLNDSAFENIQSSIDQTLNCYEKRSQFTSGVQSSIDKVGTSLDSFIQIHSVINQLLNSKDPNSLTNFCNSNGNYSNQSDSLNNQMNDGLQKLNDSLNNKKGDQQNQQGEKDKTQNQSKEGEGQQTQEKSNNGNSPQHKDILNEEEKSLMNDVENKSQNWIEEMQNIKGSGGYDPQDYLNNLFKDFRGNSEDFKSQDRNTGPGFDRKW